MNEATWRAAQTSVSLDWALNSTRSAIGQGTSWSCTASLLAALPNLTELSLLGVQVAAR